MRSDNGPDLELHLQDSGFYFNCHHRHYAASIDLWQCCHALYDKINVIPLLVDVVVYH